MFRYDDSPASVSICCDKGLCSPHHFSTGKVRRKPFELIARKPGHAGIFPPHVILHGILNLPVRVDAEHSAPRTETSRPRIDQTIHDARGACSEIRRVGELFYDARRAMVPAAI